MIRKELLEREKDRLEMFLEEDVELAVARAHEIAAWLTPEEQAVMVEWFERRAAEEFRRGEEEFEDALPPDIDPQERRGRLAGLYALWDGFTRFVHGQPSEPPPTDGPEACVRAMRGAERTVEQLRAGTEPPGSSSAI